MKYVIVGTAGHVDHGKTELTRALTGVNSDRLKEEKERGISIKLGFAPFVLDNGQKVGLVDVPGHERFIKQMLAGAAGMDLVILVVAADEGVMPQTREHLDILRLLGVKRAIVVLTKKDLVEDDWLELVEEEVHEHLADTVFAEAPMLAVSARTGENIDALRALIAEEIEQVEPKPSSGRPRLPVDRVFSVKGFGTVVTGTLWSGRIDAGDSLSLMPLGRKVRVRGIQVHGEPRQSAFAGQRVALNLSDVEVREIEHGSLLVPSGTMEASYRLDMQLFLLENQNELAHRTRVHVHVGTAELLARVLLLDRETLEPGQSAFVQLLCETPVVAARGDRVVLRTYSPVVTLGGGEILDANPPKHRRFDPEVMDRLALRLSGSVEDLALQQLRASGPMRSKELAAALDLDAAGFEELLAGLLEDGRVVRVADQIVVADMLETLAERLQSLLTDYHTRYPLRAGMSKEEVRSRLFDGYTAKAFNAVLERWADQGLFSAAHGFLSRAGFAPEPDQAERDAIEAMARRFEEAGFMPPDPREIVEEDPRNQEYYEYLLGQERLVKLTEEIVFSTSAYHEARQAIEAFLDENASLTLADARDLLASSRKYVLPLLEHFDEIKLTRRVEDRRVRAGR